MDLVIYLPGAVIMFGTIKRTHSVAMDEILKEHHTVRLFSPNRPMRVLLKKLLRPD